MTRNAPRYMHRSFAASGLLEICVVLACSNHVACVVTASGVPHRATAEHGPAKQDIKLPAAHLIGDGVAQPDKLAANKCQGMPRAESQRQATGAATSMR